MKKLLFFAFLLTFKLVDAQVNAKYTWEVPGFDEAKVRDEAFKKGIHPNDIEGYVRAARARQIAHNHGDQPEVYKERITVAEVNTNRVIGQHVMSSLCQNSDLSLGTYANWIGDISNSESSGTTYPVATWAGSGINGTNGTPVVSNTDPCNGANIANDRHIIMTMPIVGAPQSVNATAFANGYDPSCCNAGTQLYDLPMRPNNNTNSIRMGSAYPNYTSEKLVYPITVTSANQLFTYQFAVIINDGGHGVGEQPAFLFAMKDSLGNVLTQGGSTACVQYDVDATAANGDTSYIKNSINNTCFNSGSSSTYYRKWHTVTVTLNAYIGHTVFAEFQTLDCIYSGHFCYAYVTATCGALSANVSGFCGGQGSATMTAPGGFAGYQWYGPNNNNPIAGATGSVYTANPAQNGDVYSVDCITLQGCTTKLQVTVAASNILATVTTTNTCRGATSGSAAVSVTGGTQYSYNWTAGGSGTSVSNQAAGNYSVTVHDLTGNCPDTTIAYTITQTLPIVQTATAQLCGTRVVLTSPPNSPYAWYDNSNNSTGVTTQSYTATGASGGQHYTVTYKDPTTGCLDSLQTTLVAVNINFTPISSPPCNGGNNGSITINGSSSNTFPNYDWSMTGSQTGSGTNVAMPPNPILINGLPGGSYTVTVNPTGNPTCTYTMTVQLIQGQLPPPVLDTLKGCALDNLSIPTTTVVGNTHSWYQGSTSLGNTYPYVTSGVTAGAVYTDTIRNAQGCKSVYKALLKLKDFKGLITSSEGIHCHDDSTGKIKVTANQELNGPLGTPYTFTWQFPSPYTSSAPAPINAGTGVPQTTLVSNLHSGTYTCVVTSGTCTHTYTYNLTNPPLPPHDSLFAYFCPKDSLVWLYSEAGHPKYTWVHNGVVVPNYNNDSIQVTPATINDYYVYYTVAGCKDTADKLFTYPSYHALHPDKTVNIFTPNGDRHNDFFYPFYDPNISQYEIDKQMEEYNIVIYNRWGKKVYETNAYATPWNGESEGKALDDGTYYWIVRYRSNCSTKADIIEKHGYVQLLR